MNAGYFKRSAIVAVMAVASACSATRTQESAGEVIDDATVTATVKAKLIDDTTTKAHQINVETQVGIVQLTGFADSMASKSRAGELARSVDSVEEVKNDIEIRQN